MDHHIMNLQDTGLQFLSLKPHLLKCTTFAMENMRIRQKNELPTKVRHLHLARLGRNNHGKNIRP